MRALNEELGTTLVLVTHDPTLATMARPHHPPGGRARDRGHDPVIGPRFVLRMAWREGRAARRRLSLLTGAVAAGVAALVAINSFTVNLTESVAGQARELMGADLSVSSRRTFPERTAALIDSLAGTDQVARVVSFAGMAYVPRNSGVQLVQVRALEPAYPFYGEILTEPAGLWRQLAGGRNGRWWTRPCCRRWARGWATPSRSARPPSRLVVSSSTSPAVLPSPRRSDRGCSSA